MTLIEKKAIVYDLSIQRDQITRMIAKLQQEIQNGTGQNPTGDKGTGNGMPEGHKGDLEPSKRRAGSRVSGKDKKPGKRK